MADTKRVVGVAALITVGVGTANSYLKEKKPPSTRFLIGCGMTFLVLSAMSEFPTGEEIAKGLALGVMSTVLLSGEAGGLLAYIDHGEFNTKPPENNPAARTPATVRRPVQVRNPNNQFRPDTVGAIPGIVRPGTGPARATF